MNWNTPLHLAEPKQQLSMFISLCTKRDDLFAVRTDENGVSLVVEKGPMIKGGHFEQIKEN